MFDFFRKRRIKKYAEDASAYVRQKYIAPHQPSEIRYSLSVDTTVKQQKKKTESTDPTVKHQYSDSDIRYPNHILVSEPFLLDDELRQKVTEWVEWANHADPKEYDPFA